MRKKTYAVHRWIGLIVSVQLLAWSAGGFIFSILQIDAVRGEREMGASLYDPLTPDALDGLSDDAAALVRNERAAGAAVGSIALVDRGLGATWEIRDVDGVLLARDLPSTVTSDVTLTPSQAEMLARRDFAPDAEATEVRLIEDDPPTEYRRKPLPAYQVTLDHPNRTRIYIDASSGEVTARRNRQWRVFDFFWMLHTMDYRERDDFNHPLLTGFSVLAMLTALSGMSLWGWRAGSRLRRAR